VRADGKCLLGPALAGEMAINWRWWSQAFTIWRSDSLLAEIARNSVLADLTSGGKAHV
jgi:hypothetical protein